MEREKLEQVCGALRARVISNRPFSTPDLVEVLQIIGESVLDLKPEVPPEKVPAPAPKEQLPVQRHE